MFFGRSSRRLPNRSFLQQGDRGPLVRLTQAILNERGYCVDGEYIKEDNFYGPKTVKSVKLFQRDYEMVPDGKLGADGLHALIGSYKISVEGNLLQEEGESVGSPSSSGNKTKVGSPLDLLLSKLGLTVLSVILGSVAVVAENMGYLEKLPIKEIAELLSTSPPPPCPTAEHSQPPSSNS